MFMEHVVPDLAFLYCIIFLMICLSFLFFLMSVYGKHGEVLDVWCNSIENTSICQKCIFSGKWTVNVMSNQGTLFWIIQSRFESEVLSAYRR